MLRAILDLASETWRELFHVVTILMGLNCGGEVMCEYKEQLTAEAHPPQEYPMIDIRRELMVYVLELESVFIASYQLLPAANKEGNYMSFEQRDSRPDGPGQHALLRANRLHALTPITRVSRRHHRLKATFVLPQ